MYVYNYYNILCKESQRLTLENMYSAYEGNRPVIFGDQDSLDINSIKSVNTNAPFIADKIMEYKKEIWNELLSFLGINNLATEKKERLITDEASSNNELINKVHKELSNRNPNYLAEIIKILKWN